MCICTTELGFQGGLVVKYPPANAGDARDVGLIPELEGSPGEGNGNSLQYSCLGNPMTKEPGVLWSIRLQRVGHNSNNLALTLQQ